MPIIRRFKPTIGAPTSAAPIPAGDHAPPALASPTGPGPGASTATAPTHHHHRHHSVSISQEPPVVIPASNGLLPLKISAPSVVEETVAISPRKRPTSISLSIHHTQVISPTPKSATPAQTSTTTSSTAPEIPPIVVTTTTTTEPPKIRRAHQIFQENVITMNKPASPSCSSSSRPSSPTPSLALSTTSSLTFGNGQPRKHRSLLQRPIELPNKEEIVVEKLKMRDFLLFNPDGSPMRWHRQQLEQQPEENVLQSTSSNIKQRLRSTSMMSPPPPLASQQQPGGTPRVKLGASGEAIINEESLIIDTTASRPDPNLVSKIGAVHEEMESSTTYTTYANYRRKGKVRGRRWSKEETARFFVALRCCGLDFSMISKFFPDREERELRSKFKAEDKRDPEVVTRFLSGNVGDDDLGSYDPLALLATSSSFGSDSKKKKEKPVKKEQPNSNSKRGEGVPRGRGGKVRLTFGEDSVSSDSGAESDEEELAKKPRTTKRKVIISESTSDVTTKEQPQSV